MMTISDLCYETNPCRHQVKIDNEPKGRWKAEDIVAYLEQQGQPVPEHFTYILTERGKRQLLAQITRTLAANQSAIDLVREWLSRYRSHYVIQLAAAGNAEVMTYLKYRWYYRKVADQLKRFRGLKTSSV